MTLMASPLIAPQPLQVEELDLSREHLPRPHRAGLSAEYCDEYSGFIHLIRHESWKMTLKLLRSNPPRRYSECFPEDAFDHPRTGDYLRGVQRLDEIADEVTNLAKGEMTLRQFADLSREVYETIWGKLRAESLCLREAEVLELEAVEPKITDPACTTSDVGV